jgi:hypothetical protein
VGNDGETLVADSSTATGLRYTAGTVQSNPVLNSAFQIWQRGTSFAIPSGGTTNYTADRWLVYRGATGSTVSRQATGDTTNLPNIQYCARFQRDSGNTSTQNLNLYNVFESVNSIPLAGKTITVSFYARAGANFSSASNNLAFYGTSGTGTDQNPITGLTGGSTFLGITATLTTTWQRFTGTATMAANATQFYVQAFYTPSGTAGAADFFEITGVQVDVGNVALPFRTYAGTIQGELAACQRYYQVLNLSDNGIIGNSYSTTAATAALFFISEMRVAPTVILAAAGQSSGQISFTTGAQAYPTTTGTHTADRIRNNSFRVNGVSYVGLTSASVSNLYATGGTVVYTASAEL